MNREDLKALDVAGRLPTPNAVALKLLRLLKSETTSTQEIGRAIQCDPALAGRIIGAANAMSLRGPRRIVSAIEGLRRVGTVATCRLALGFSVLSSHRTGRCAAFDYRGFWVRSVLRGITMQALATRARFVAPEEAFTLGLMSQIGKLALATLFPDAYNATFAREDDWRPAERIAAERAAFATDHVELTEYMLSSWGFPEAMIEPVGLCGRGTFNTLSSGSRRRLCVDALRLADMTARSGVGQATGESTSVDFMSVAGALDLSQDDLRTLGQEVSAAWPAWARVLDLAEDDVGALDLHSQADAASTQEADAPPVAAAEPAHAVRVLFVGADRNAFAGLGALLPGTDMGVHFADDDESGLRKALRLVPQVIVYAWRERAASGLDFCKMLRKSAIGGAAYILVLGDTRPKEALAEALDAGADDLLQWPASLDAVAGRMRVGCRIAGLQSALARDRDDLHRYAVGQATANRRLREAARADPLTGLPNRRAAMDQLEVEWAVAQRTGAPLACLMIHVDDFQGITEQFGPAAGDVVLSKVAATLRDTSRASDTVCRIGGEEFLVICRQSDRTAAAQCADRLRISVGSQPVTLEGRPRAVTLTIGIANTHDAGIADRHALLESADRALYAAKREGRHRSAAAA